MPEIEGIIKEVSKIGLLDDVKVVVNTNEENRSIYKTRWNGDEKCVRDDFFKNAEKYLGKKVMVKVEKVKLSLTDYIAEKFLFGKLSQPRNYYEMLDTPIEVVSGTQETL